MRAARPKLPGRSLDPIGNGWARGMIALPLSDLRSQFEISNLKAGDRIRLTDLLSLHRHFPLTSPYASHRLSAAYPSSISLE